MTAFRKTSVTDVLSLGVICLMLCLGSNAVAQTDVGQAAGDSTAVADEDTLLTFTLPDYRYQTEGKRDPFESLAPEEVSEEEEEEQKKIKELFSYEEAVVLGIVNSDSDSYALVSDQNGLSYVLRAGDRVFGGYVTDITEDAVFMHIVKYGRAMTIIVRMDASKFTVIEEAEAETNIRKPGINVTYKPGPKAQGGISIEEVIIVDPYVRTIEDDWFDGQKELPRPDDASSKQAEPSRAESFRLVDPENNAWIRLPYMVDWTSAPGANNVYTILIDDNADFSSPVFMKEGITATSYTIMQDLALPMNTGLYWKVIAYDKKGTRIEPVQTRMKFQVTGQ